MQTARMRVQAVSFPGEQPGLANMVVFGPGVNSNAHAEVVPEATVLDMNLVWDSVTEGRIVNHSLSSIANANTWMSAASYITAGSSAKIVFSGGNASDPASVFPRSGFSIFLPGSTLGTAMYPNPSTFAPPEVMQPDKMYRYGSMVRLANHLILAGGLQNGRFEAIEVLSSHTGSWKYVK